MSKAQYEAMTDDMIIDAVNVIRPTVLALVHEYYLNESKDSSKSSRIRVLCDSIKALCLERGLA